MGIQRHHRPRPELLADHEVRGADHAVRLDRRLGHGMPLDGEAHPLQQFGGTLGVGDAVARRVVRRHLDQFGQKLGLGLVPAVYAVSDRLLLVGVMASSFCAWRSPSGSAKVTL